MNETRKVAVVTGAARGIGLAFAQKFLAEGYCVALLDVDAETLAHLPSLDIQQHPLPVTENSCYRPCH